MFYRQILRYDLSSRRVRLPHGPCEIKYLTVDGENLIFDGRFVQKPRYKEKFKVNDRSIFIYPLRYDAEIDVTYEVRDMLSMDQIQEMAAKFWIKTGEAPTHLLMTTDQQNELSLVFHPKERVSVQLDGLGAASRPKITQLGVAPGVMIDILAVAPLRSGNTNQIDFPKMVRITD